jgi:hypothetical protein
VSRPVDCLTVGGRRAALSGVLDAPVAGLTHLLVVVEDKGAKRRPRDKAVIWLSNQRLDCAIEFDGVLADARKRIKRGEIVV